MRFLALNQSNITDNGVTGGRGQYSWDFIFILNLHFYIVSQKEVYTPVKSNKAVC